jgi:hypothetical protein
MGTEMLHINSIDENDVDDNDKHSGVLVYTVHIQFSVTTM